jgi:hypothetical protein
MDLHTSPLGTFKGGMGAKREQMTFGFYPYLSVVSCLCLLDGLIASTFHGAGVLLVIQKLCPAAERIGTCRYP